MQVITGGIEAKYGDVTGGIISITTKGPSQKFSGGVELRLLNSWIHYGYNLISANLSGPILRKKSTNESIIGFRFSGQYIDRGDDNPRAFGVYRATESAIDRIESDPIELFNGSPISSAERLEEGDVELLKAAPNSGSTQI